MAPSAPLIRDVSVSVTGKELRTVLHQMYYTKLQDLSLKLSKKAGSIHVGIDRKFHEG